MQEGKYYLEFPHNYILSRATFTDPEKTDRTNVQNVKFIDKLIAQWMKRTGSDDPLQTEEVFAFFSLLSIQFLRIKLFNK